MDRLKVLARNKLFVRSVLLAGLAAAGYSLPDGAVDPIVSLLVGLIGG